VLVAIPGGDERNGPTIVARYNQSRDTFPRTVGGIDVTKNTTSFRRRMAPMVFESGTALLLRNAATTAYLSLDPQGNSTLTSGDGHYLALHADLLSLQTADNSCAVQLNPSKQTVYLQAGPTNLLLDSQGKSAFLTTGTLSMVTSGGGYAPGHAVTLEQVVNILNTVFASAAAAATAAPALVAFFASFSAPAVLGAMIEQAATGSVLAPYAGIASFVTSALTSSPADPSGNSPGAGRPGFTY
jgi:hypothetical protein